MTTSRPTSPQDGDVVIARDMERGNDAYTISAVPADPQVRYTRYEHAVAAATEWAMRAHVAIWFTEDGKSFTVLELAGRQKPASRGVRSAQSER